MRMNKIDRLARIGRSLLLIGFLALCVAMTAQAQTFSVLYNFNWPGPVQPASGVTMDAAGNLYGTATGIYGGTGAVYKLSEKNGNWVLSPLLSFKGQDGHLPLSRPIFGPDGLLFGTTADGGFGCDLGCGNVYSLQPPATACRSFLCYWTGVSIYDFGSIPDDGAGPLFGDLLFDAGGNIYGTTSFNVPGYNLLYGTVYELSKSQGAWNETILHQFGLGNDGYDPQSGVIRDQAGNLYGTTAEGGTNPACHEEMGCGIVYELSPSGSGWGEQILYSFQGPSDGSNPIGGLVMDSQGNLYGTTSQGGANGGGTVFELSPSGGSWNLTTLYSFTATGNGYEYCNGQNGTLLLNSAGNIFGTTCSNGAYGYGAIFELTKSDGSWIYSSLHDFTDGDDGAYPVGNPSFDSNGNIYGTALSGGSFIYGTAWKLTL